MPRREPPEGYVYASEAKRLLGGGVPITDGALGYYVQKGYLKRYVPRGFKQGFYKVEEIERLLQSRDILEPYSYPGAIDSSANLDDDSDG
jgi:hypothetical protein